jgi:hypothetical protein
LQILSSEYCIPHATREHRRRSEQPAAENPAFRKHCIQKTLHSENTAEKNADAYVADTPAIFADLLKLNLKVKFFAVSHGETD